MRSHRYKNPFIRFLHNLGKSPLSLIEGLQILALLWVLTHTLIGFGGFLAYGEPMVGVSRDLFILAALHALVIAFRRHKHGLDWELLIPLPVLLYGWFHFQFLSPTPWNAALYLTVFAQAYALYFITFNSVKNSKSGFWPLIACQAVVMIALLTAFFQFYQYPGWMVSMDRERNPDYLVGAAGLLLDPVTLGSLILLCWPASVIIVLLKRFPGPVRAFNAFLILALFVGLILSSHLYGFAILLVLVSILPFFISKRRSVRMAFLKYSLMVLFFVIPVFWFATDALRTRMYGFIEAPVDPLSGASVEVALRQFLESPMLGNGLGSFAQLWEQTRPEGVAGTSLYPLSSYLGTLAETGLVGLAGFALLVGLILFRAFRTWLSMPYLVVKKEVKERMDRYPRNHPRRAKIERRYGQAPALKVVLGSLLLGLPAFLAYVAWDYSLFLPLHLFLLGCALGAAAAYSRRKDRRSVSRLLGCATALVPLVLATWAILFGVPKFYAQHLVYTMGERFDYLIEDPDRIFLDPGSLSPLIAACEDAAKLNPGHAGAWRGLGRSWLARLHADLWPANELAETAIPYLEESLQLQPDSWVTNFELARAHSILDEGDQQMARSYLDAAIELAPFRIEPLVYKASLLLLEDNDSREGRELLERAQGINPDYEPLQTMLSRLNLGERRPGGRRMNAIFTPSLLAQQFDVLPTRKERVLAAGILVIEEDVVPTPGDE